jgi:hypothetical protein
MATLTDALARGVIAIFGVAEHARAERRKARCEMHVDRRKSAIDVIEHVVLGVRRTHVRARSDVARRVRSRRDKDTTSV